MKHYLTKVLLCAFCLTAIGFIGGCNNEQNTTKIDITTLPKEIVDPIKPDTIYLLAELKEDNIYLYNLEDRQHVLLINGDQQTILEWDCLSPRLELPDMKFADYDGDGNKELAVSLHNDEGTGISVAELHIVSWKGKKVTDHIYNEEDYVKQLEEQTSWRYDADSGKGIFHCGNSDYYVREFTYSNFAEVEGLAWGDQVNFELTDDGKMKAIFAVGLIRDWATPEYHGSLITDILYKKGKFMMDSDSMIYKEADDFYYE